MNTSNTRTEALLDTIRSRHEWREGQVYSHGGTCYSSTDECRICGLRWVWESDTQNGVDGDVTLLTAGGSPITLREAVELEC